MKHKHYDMIVAWASGKEIQFKAFRDSDWDDVDMDGEEWYEHYTYRIKPEPQLDFVKVFYLESNSVIGLRFSQAFVESDTKGASRIRCVFDGETTRLKSVELLQ
jgi:hypothetical protein